MKRLLLSFIIFTLVLSAVFAQDTGEQTASEADENKAVTANFSLFSWSVGISVLFFTEDDDLESAPAPILPSPSLAFGVFPFRMPFITIGAEAALDCYMTNYKWSYNLSRPVPAEIENRSAFVISPVIAAHAVVKVRPLSQVGFRVYAGFSFDIRIVMTALDLNYDDLHGEHNAEEQTALIKEYMWAENRWIYPVLGVGLDIRVGEKWDAGIDFRVWYPYFQKQTSELIPEKNDWRFGAGIKFIHR
jgi:hypothetical protein